MNRVKVIGIKKFFNPSDNGFKPFSDGHIENQNVLRYADLQPRTLSNIFDYVVSDFEKYTRNIRDVEFSDYITLKDVDHDIISKENLKIKLNLDYSYLNNLATFSSLKELFRVTLEEIILSWPASIFVNNINSLGETVLTIEDYSYNEIYNYSTFKTNVSNFVNKFNVGYYINDVDDLDNQRNLSRNYSFPEINDYDKYYIFYNDKEFEILEYTPSPTKYNSYAYLKVLGNPFEELLSNNGSLKYHIKPNKFVIERFFNELSDFGRFLLNRHTYPKFSFKINVIYNDQNGNVVYSNKNFQWTTSDGYNIDFDNDKYFVFITDLLKLIELSDNYRTNILIRELVDDSIVDFDTISFNDINFDSIYLESQKIKKLLQIYAVSFDEIKKYIDGLRYVNNITYNKNNNLPDVLLKKYANNIGWDVINLFDKYNTLLYFVNEVNSVYENNENQISLFEIENEFWRRLIINSSWVWKNKGTRKCIDFLIKMLGIPDGFINFNEYVYVSKNKLDYEKLKKIVEKFNIDIKQLPVDYYGYPKLKKNTSNDYFQMKGMWYRETAGENSNIDKFIGNNPHIGTYDYGYSYYEKLKCLIPDFNNVNIIEQYYTVDDVNYYYNYNNGTFNGLDEHIIYATGKFKLPPKILKPHICTQPFDVTINWNLIIKFDGYTIYSGNTFYSTNDLDNPLNIINFDIELQNSLQSIGFDVVKDNDNYIIYFNDDGFNLCETPEIVGKKIKFILCYSYNSETQKLPINCFNNCIDIGEFMFDEHLVDFDTTINIYDSFNNPYNHCYTVTTEIIRSPKPRLPKTICGCDKNICDNVLKICIEKNIDNHSISCDDIIDYEKLSNGFYLIYYSEGKSYEINPECCKSLNGIPFRIGNEQRCVWNMDIVVGIINNNDDEQLQNIQIL